MSSNCPLQAELDPIVRFRCSNSRCHFQVPLLPSHWGHLTVNCEHVACLYFKSGFPKHPLLVCWKSTWLYSHDGLMNVTVSREITARLKVTLTHLGPRSPKAPSFNWGVCVWGVGGITVPAKPHCFSKGLNKMCKQKTY